MSPPGGSLVNHVVLKPQGREFQTDALLDNGRDVLGPTKYIHDIHLLAGLQRVRQVSEIRDSPLPKNFLRGRGDGNDPVAKVL